LVFDRGKTEMRHFSNYRENGNAPVCDLQKFIPKNLNPTTNFNEKKSI